MFWKPILLWKMYLRIRHININKNMYRSKKRCTESENNVQRQSSRGLLKKGVLTNLVKFTGKHLYHSLFFNKVADHRPAVLLKKRPWHMWFLRTHFLRNNSGWPLMQIIRVTLNKRISNSSLLEFFFKIGVLKYFVVFTRKHLCWSLLFNKFADWRPIALMKKLLVQGFYCEFC